MNETRKPGMCKAGVSDPLGFAHTVQCGLAGFDGCFEMRKYYQNMFFIRCLVTTTDHLAQMTRRRVFLLAAKDIKATLAYLPQAHREKIVNFPEKKDIFC